MCKQIKPSCETTLPVSHIQHFSVGDGPGIRTTVFLKGCNLRCPWCHNPETQSASPETLVYANAGQRVMYGTPMTVAEVAAACRADLPFYESSGGGVTVSGGECMLYPGALAVLLAELKQGNALHTLVDTAGCVPYASFEAVNPWTDIYFFDLKTADAAGYASIGGDLALVVSNIKQLLADGKQVRVRIPLIPGFNADMQHMEALRDLIWDIGNVAVDLLPFHRLGAGKYTALGRTYAYRDVPPLSLSEAEALAMPLRAAGVTVRIEK